MKKRRFPFFPTTATHIKGGSTLMGKLSPHLTFSPLILHTTSFLTALFPLFNTDISLFHARRGTLTLGCIESKFVRYTTLRWMDGDFGGERKSSISSRSKRCRKNFILYANPRPMPCQSLTHSAERHFTTE